MYWSFDRSPVSKMGFRPLYTNPYRAAQLSGLSLGDLGALSGTPALDGTILTYQGNWGSGYINGPQDVISAVTGALQTKWGLMVRGFSTDAGIVSDVTRGNYNVTLQLQVNTNQGGYGDVNDVISIIDGEVYNAAGSMPLSGSIPSVRQPSQPTPTQTGQPSPTQPGSPVQPNSLLTWLGLNSGSGVQPGASGSLALGGGAAVLALVALGIVLLKR